MSKEAAEKKDDEENGIQPTLSTQPGTYIQGIVHDDVFGDITQGGPNYRALGWKGTVVLMLKTQIGLGVLTIPQTFSVLGLIPGTICVVLIAAMITWSNYVIGIFKLRYPNVYGIEDIGQMFMGKFGYEFLGIMFAIYWITTASSSFIGWSTALNAISSHATCTAVYVAVAAILAAYLGSIQTLGRISLLSWIGISSILISGQHYTDHSSSISLPLTETLESVLALVISVGVQDRPASAPQSGPWQSDYVLFANPSPAEAFAAVSTIVFSFAGTPAFFNIAAEMRDPRMYTRAVLICQSIMTIIYVTLGIVVYHYCGSYVSSPALGSAGTTMKKVCYAIALPGLTVSITLFIHFTAKYLLLRFLRGTKHLTQNTPTHWATWLGCTVGSALLAYIIASAVPNLSGLVSLVGAVGGTIMSLQPMGFMWLYMFWGEKKTTKSMLWASWAVFVIVSGSFLTIAGTYGALSDIIADYRALGGTAAWTCADNSGS
ncbi:hypothetical protein PFICI_14001 [Pestalotiopsis fici W106-1]|uniref:Amino acid transporter transmembrane domain-containing protein n=1 Tax=Pestalotiopsis fici (strain W106-1 / CGMCC3.15140) TaxID=1229662 RepID=W3WJN0_PESFW|nr:uncharacterized protein PFICI_14001 [Pestalotiopsis fici W106-1]ETS74135.1 hypothetical protein PFICI_14001 [Pestalotiopsis fici W106-1]